MKQNKNMKRVCIIGAGVAGLCSARYLAEEPSISEIVVLEMTDNVGGQWRYTDEVGVDKNGLPIHTSMYQHLRTNLPKPTMELPEFPMPKEYASFPDWESFMRYLGSFADHFDLHKYVKFHQQVTSVRRDGEEWRVSWRDVCTGGLTEGDFDAIFICTGHNSHPHRPNIPGEKEFTGKIIHSHDYRKPDVYKDQCVLVIGAGPSGVDISLDLTTSCHRVLLSHHNHKKISTPFLDNLIQLPDVEKFIAGGVVFTDGHVEEVDAVIYCTGYDFNYPFLDASCGLVTGEKHITPLYRHLVNAQHPTVFVLGLPGPTCMIILIDAQARYATRLLAGGFQLSSVTAMLQWVQQQREERVQRGLSDKATHNVGHNEDQYYGELSTESGTARVPPVIARIHTDVLLKKKQNLLTYRNYSYTVLDDERFEQVYMPPVLGKKALNA